MIRISTKLTLAASVAISIVTVFNALQRVQRERELFEGDLRRDHQVLGTALAETTGALMERAGAEEALLTLEDLNSRRAHVNLRWVLDDVGRATSGIRETESGERILATHIPVETTSGPAGYIELTQSLTPQDRYMRDSVERIAMWALVTILASALLVHLAGWLLLARPLSPILGKIHRVGQGDLSGPLRMRRTDELGTIAAELDQMCAQLSDLQARAKEETDARIAALDQLRHADRLGTVGKLASGVAHELGTPLNVVSARAKMILRGESEKPEEIADDARVIVEQSERMTRIIRQLLDFARPRQPSREPADLSALAGSIVAMLGPLAAKSSVELTLIGEPVEAEVDVGQIQQVMTNLVMNAIQAQPAGGKVELHVESDGDRALLRVTDEGAGISEDARARIFEPFFTTKEVGEGTGLGLSVVHGIVQEHGGRIRVEHRERGTVFAVELPRRVAP